MVKVDCCVVLTHLTCCTCTSTRALCLLSSRVASTVFVGLLVPLLLASPVVFIESVVFVSKSVGSGRMLDPSKRQDHELMMPFDFTR